jgi:hypothetical protein
MLQNHYKNYSNEDQAYPIPLLIQGTTGLSKRKTDIRCYWQCPGVFAQYKGKKISSHHFEARFKEGL